jgi:putative PIG3 family NAD(P)H quinone oxidoreductase
MRVVEYAGAGGPEVIQLGERTRPTPGEGEVLIRVAAAGVNRPDLLQRAGHYPPPPGASDVPGLELSGTIVELGNAVWEWAEGDQVTALVSGGGYAEYCTAAAGHCLAVGGSLDLAEAAAIPETLFTVYANVFEASRLVPGERVLVHGGASGIGTMAILLATAHGCAVVTTARGSERVQRCRDLGAVLAVDYGEQDFVEEVRRHFDESHPIDVVLDMVGGDYLNRNLSLMRTGGRHSSIAFLRGRQSTVDLREVMTRRLILTGSTLRSRSTDEKRRLRDAIRGRFWDRFVRGDLEPVISHRFPLSAVARAHAVLERSEQFGKVILEL